MSDELCVILNPRAGRGGGDRVRSQVTTALREAGLSFQVRETARPGHATELALEARTNGHRVIVAVGGDGTANEVINGLAQAVAEGEPVGTLALWPVGTGNDLADMVGIGQGTFALVEHIARGRIRRIDLGRITLEGEAGRVVRYFGNNVGIGFEARVTLESYKIKRIGGWLRYLLAVFAALRHYRAPEIELEWATPAGTWERRRQRSLLVSVGNSRRTGGAFYLVPDAVMDDGLLDIAVAQSLSIVGILRLLPKVMRGAHRNHPAIEFARSRHIRFTCPSTVPVHVDGEVVMADARAVEIELLPGGLEVLV